MGHVMPFLNLGIAIAAMWFYVILGVVEVAKTSWQNGLVSSVLPHPHILIPHEENRWDEHVMSFFVDIQN